MAICCVDSIFKAESCNSYDFTLKLTTTPFCIHYRGVFFLFISENILFLFCGRVAWLYQCWPGGVMVLWFYVQEHLKAQPAVVLVLKRLRRRGNGLKSHPTDWEKPGIEPATPGLQDIGLSHTPRRPLCSQFGLKTC